MNNLHSIGSYSFYNNLGTILYDGEGYRVTADEQALVYFWAGTYEEALNIREELLRGI